jgi:hypothetical protein
MGLTEFLVNLILGFTVFYVLRGLIFRVLAGGMLTGNRYGRGPDGKIWVKHPGGEWVRLEDHEKEQKRLRENK